MRGRYDDHDDQDRCDDVDPEEPNRFCANGHAWVNGIARGSRGSYGEPLEPDEDSCPDCPECGETGWSDPGEAQDHCTHDPGFVQIEELRAVDGDGGNARVCGHCGADLDPPSTTIRPVCSSGKHLGPFRPSGRVDQENGHELLDCACGSTLCRPLTWVSPWPEDYVPGHPLNAWGAFRDGEPRSGDE